MFTMFDIYKNYYLMGLFTDDNLLLFESVGDLTADQVKEIQAAKAA